MTISHDQIRQLAEFQDSNSSALSFYYQPSTPSNKAHKEIAIQIKDLTRDVQRRLENGNSSGKAAKESLRADLDRIIGLADEFRSNGAHAKAIFACADQNLWLEYDLPTSLPGTQLFVDRHFHLKPLAHLLGAVPLLGVVLIDRHRARIFELRLGEWTEREDLFHPQPRRGRSDGFAGYDAGHA